ncbi:hypothetical protein CF326_g4931 [Tilletia indica]|nr:hypothetical protein CF326_g4931 [Tilletia indica]
MNPSTSPPVPMQHRLAVDWTLLVITVLADPDLPPAKRDRLKVASLRLTTEILRDVSTPTSSNMDAWFEDWCAFLVAAGKNGNQPQVDEAIANVTKAVLRLAQSPVSAPPTSEMSDSDIFSALAFGPQQSTPALQLHQADQSAARAHSANTINPSDLTVAMCAPFYFQDPTLFSSPGLYVAPSTAAVGKRKLSELEASGSPISHRPQERTVLGNISNQSQPQQPETRPDQTPRANLERTSQPPKNNPAAKIVVDLIAEEGSFLANQIYRILSGRGSKKMSCQEEQDKADEILRFKVGTWRRTNGDVRFQRA